MVFILQNLVTLISIMLAIGFFSLFERKVLGLMQARKGPGKVILLGIGQPLGDALKLLTKQSPVPNSSNKLIYMLTPSALFTVVMFLWVIPWNYSMISLGNELLLVLVIFSVTAFGPILMGWAANSKYSVIGSMRAIAQALSFEIIMSLSIMSFCGLMSSFCSSSFISMKAVGLVLPVPCALFLVSMIAESGRSPFDLPEGESELVSGYSVDYGGALYKMIFLLENISSLFGGGLMSLICFPPFSWMKCITFAFILVWIRATLPRIRYDTMMSLCWIHLLPVSIGSMLVAMLSIYVLINQTLNLTPDD